MLFNDDRDSLRQMYFTAWQKYQENQLLLEPLDEKLIKIILMHPEYHQILDNPDKYLRQDYSAEQGLSNPFMHMGLHVSILEQISTDRPRGITTLYQQLAKQKSDEHIAQHLIMECLAEILWQAQRYHQAPDENNYLLKIRQLIG